MVTSLKAWMAAEEFDETEPVNYYVAGAKGWDDTRLVKLRRRQQEGLEGDRLYPTPEWAEVED